MKATLSQRIWTFANPHNFMQLSARMLPWVAGGAVVFLAVGFGWSLFATEPDAQHGQAIKIFFIHVPASWMAINVYLIMVVASLIGMIRSHPVSHLVAKAAAPDRLRLHRDRHCHWRALGHARLG